MLETRTKWRIAGRFAHNRRSIAQQSGVAVSTIRLLLPDMPDHSEVIPYLREMDAARWYTNYGPLVLRFEDALGPLLGRPAPERCSVANCTLGLELAFTALGLPRGARVLLPALTFVATATAVLRAGMTPVLADVDAQSWLLGADTARELVRRQKIDCVMPVATYGCPLPLQAWDDFSTDTGIPVLIDAAGAFGNQLVSEHTTVVFSFHATKTFGIGEGGVVCAQSKPVIAALKQLSNFGIDISTGLAMGPGSNAKLSEYHAAVGLAALKSWPERMARRRKLHADYLDELRRSCPQVTLQQRPQDGVYSIMQVRLPAGIANTAVAAALKAKGIETRLWYLPLLGDHPAFAAAAIAGGLPVARALATSMIGLPFHLQLDAKAIQTVCAALADAMAKHG